MALKIDNQDSSLGSMDDKRLQVIFKHLNGVEVIKTPDTKMINEVPWVADSIGDLPMVGDWVVLPEFKDKEETASSMNGFKVVGRHLDFGPFVRNGERIQCTILVEAGLE